MLVVLENMKSSPMARDNSFGSIESNDFSNTIAVIGSVSYEVLRLLALDKVCRLCL